MGLENLFWINLIAFVPLLIFGTLLHFAYDWSKHNGVVAVFASVNESYWEHIKIAFWPLLIWFIALFALGGWSISGFIPAATVALYAVPVTMVAVVFTYKGVTRRNILWIDILSFFITIGVALTIFTLLATELAASQSTVWLSLLFLVIIGIAFARYTVKPPVESDLFIDPLNDQYGLSAHPDN